MSKSPYRSPTWRRPGEVWSKAIVNWKDVKASHPVRFHVASSPRLVETTYLAPVSFTEKERVYKKFNR